MSETVSVNIDVKNNKFIRDKIENKDPVVETYLKNIVENEKVDNMENNEPQVINESEPKNSGYKTAIIGIGQCGGNIANIATGKFVTCAVNTSQEDLMNINTTYKYLFNTSANSGGSGKERSRSKKIFADNIDNFNKFFKSNFNDCKNIIIIASAGGGTGGGSAPMCARFLKDNYPNKNIFLIFILGSIRDDIKSQENMLSVMEEINKCQLNYLIFDNDKVSDTSNTLEVYKKINEDVIKACEFIARRYFVESSISNIDHIDMQKLFIENKRMMIVSGKLDKRVSNGLNYEEQIINAIKKSTQIEPYTPMSYAVFLSVENGIYDNIDTNFMSLISEFGDPYEIYKHFQPKLESNDVPDFVVCMTGLPDCVSRYEIINSRVREFNERRTSNKSINDVEKVIINARNTNVVDMLDGEETSVDKTNKASLDMFM